MRKVLALLAITMLVLGGLAVYAGIAPGPAPNAGDGTPDGSGDEMLPGPFGYGEAPGPAPNAGDGVPDGSGF